MDCHFELTPPRQLWLEHLDRDAGVLHAHLAHKHSHRLGIYFERLWQFFLLQDPEVELLAHNLPIHHDGRTLGEFDCLYFCHRRQQTVHLELAVKYFLGNHSEQPSRTWLGPDCKDSLDAKIGHLLERQIRLSEQPAAITALAKLDIANPLCEVAVKGCLFQPVLKPLPAPSGYNPERSFSQWLHQHEVASLPQPKGTSFAVLPKLQWLSPAYNIAQELRLSAPDLHNFMEEHFAQDHFPKLIVQLDAQGNEQQRWFITPTVWPIQ